MNPLENGEKCPRCQTFGLILNPELGKGCCYNCGFEIKLCPYCHEFSCVVESDKTEHCNECGYIKDPNSAEILRDIQDEISEDLLYDVDIESIFKYGFDRINQLRRSLVQFRCQIILKIGIYSPNYSLNRSNP